VQLLPNLYQVSGTVSGLSGSQVGDVVDECNVYCFNAFSDHALAILFSDHALAILFSDHALAILFSDHALAILLTA